MPSLETAADKQYQLQLPKVSFREIKDDPELLKPAGVLSVRFAKSIRLEAKLSLFQEQSRSYGCTHHELISCAQADSSKIMIIRISSVQYSTYGI
jgi:hypothetical protein